MESSIREERLAPEEYIAFLRRTDLGSQYPKERFRERIGVCMGVTDFAHWLFMTDLGVVREYTGRGIGRALAEKLHELAGGGDDIILYTCANENAVGFCEKLGMVRPDDVFVRSRIQWTNFTVE